MFEGSNLAAPVIRNAFTKIQKVCTKLGQSGQSWQLGQLGKSGTFTQLRNWVPTLRGGALDILRGTILMQTIQPRVAKCTGSCNWHINVPGVCTIKKHYRLVMKVFCIKLVCLFKLMCLSKLMKVTDTIKDTSLIQNLSFFCTLHIRNVYNADPWSLYCKTFINSVLWLARVFVPFCHFYPSLIFARIAPLTGEGKCGSEWQWQTL